MGAFVTGRLIGRAQECAQLRQLLERTRAGDPQVLIVRGEPGIGKTALLDYLADSATGFQVIGTAGVESDMELAFAGLQQLCAPVLDCAAELPEPQRAALQTAFGLSSGPAPDRFLVGLAVLGLLAGAAVERPVLCLVDDAQWLDQVTAQTLGFVARRLAAGPVALVFALREPVDGLTGLPRLVLRGLGDADARALLASAVAGRIDTQVRDRIVAETHGNPLALLELPRGLSSAELAGGYHRPDVQPVAGQIEQHFLARIRSLPGDTQQLLLLAAAEPVGDPTLLLRAAQLLGLPGEALTPAEEAGLLETGARVRFRHPLVRSAVYRAAQHGERRQAHRALAEATDPAHDPDRRAWHGAHAAAAPDESVAAELEHSAGRAQLRGGTAAAAAFLSRATELTPDAALRGARALDAAEAMRAAAELDAADALLDTAEMAPLDDLQRARVARIRAVLAFTRGRGTGDAPALTQSVHKLFDAATQLADLDGPMAQDAMLEAVSAAMYAGREFGPGMRTDIATMLTAQPLATPHRPTGLLLHGLATRIAAGYTAGLAPMRAAIAAITPETWSWQAFPVAHEAVVHDLWDDESWHRIATDAVRVATGTGALAALPTALTTRAGVHVQAGEFASARALLAEARSLSAAAGQTPVRYHELALAAWAGDEAQATVLIEAATRDGAARGEGRISALVGYATAVLHLGLGHYPVACAALRRACEYEDLGLYGWNLVELVEAAVRAGEHAVALDALAQLEERTSAAGTDLALGVLARSRALVSQGSAAEDCYREALERLAGVRMAVQLPRTQLVYGEWLRRENRRSDARAQLRTAHAVFSRMGAQAFAERSRRELQATGEKAGKRPTGPGDALTPQEQQIAELAGAGLTNTEIGAQLFISAHTVEWHLRKVFAKLGIRSRRQLRDTPWR
ncbi:helix-turn-helix transcriptional regulator [Mycolicibacter terrae]|uniref:Helix-turn-helix transcriptional regulator n=1 Tax=Mycolicibacter terrae TaxID=1788 RepID=A0ACD2EN19_9MYCO|nr:LuxR family transcriptional regulator [Mycolicibacter terrae]RRR44761.1 helix-turn-helix transcriptional regulator [Mycolicibacter terrae]